MNSVPALFRQDMSHSLGHEIVTVCVRKTALNSVAVLFLSLFLLLVVLQRQLFFVARTHMPLQPNITPDSLLTAADRFVGGPEEGIIMTTQSNQATTKKSKRLICFATCVFFGLVLLYIVSSTLTFLLKLVENERLTVSLLDSISQAYKDEKNNTLVAVRQYGSGLSLSD